MSSNEVFPPVKGRLIDAGDSTVTGLFYGFQPWEDSTLTSIAFVSGFSGVANVGSQSLKAGMFYHVRFTSIRVATGSIMIFEGA